MKTLYKLAIVTFFAISGSNIYANDKGWEILPGTKDGFIFDHSIAVMAGPFQSTTQIGERTTGMGIELSMNCMIIQPPTNRIRQQVSYFMYEDGESEIQTTELNPHYLFEILPKLEIGAGPGVGYIRTRVDGKSANLLAAQFGGSLHYRFKKLFLGAEARYQVTPKADVGDGKENGARNARATLKIGYNF